jgi:uncharacterized protein (DUF305 family)
MNRYLKLLAVLALTTGLAACGKTDSHEGNMSEDTSSTVPASPAANTNAHGNMPMSGNMEQDMQMMNAKMVEALGPADANYDDRFIDMMIPHHEGAIAMAKDAKAKSQRPEIKKLADDIIAAQEQEIAQLKKWRSEWYGH